VQLVTRLDRARWEPALFCLAGRGVLADEFTAAGIPVVCLGARRWTNFGALWRLVHQLRRFRPAILQTFLFHANLAGRIAGTLAGVRTIVSGIRVAERRSSLPLWLDRWTNGLVTANVCVSQAVADFSISRVGLSPPKIVVIPNGVDAARFSNVRAADLSFFGISPGSQVLLTIGRLDSQKGLRDLIEAAALVIPKHPHVHFLLVGEGPERPAIERSIREKGLAERVHLTGWRPDVPRITLRWLRPCPVVALGRDAQRHPRSDGRRPAGDCDTSRGHVGTDSLKVKPDCSSRQNHPRKSPWRWRNS